MDAETKRGMDAAAEQARSELLDLIEEGKMQRETINEMKAWLKRNYLAAGYKRLARVIMSSLLFLGCAGAPVCSIDNIYVYDAEVCLEAYAEAMDDEECFTDTCCEMREMDEMAYHQATGRVWQ